MLHDDVATRVTPPLFFVVKATRRLLLALTITLTFGGGAAREATAQRQPGRPLPPQVRQPLAGTERLRAWLTAIEQHEPGRVDEPALAISLWSRSELDAAMADLRALLDRVGGMVSRNQRSSDHATTKTESGPLTLADVRVLLDLTDDEIRRRDPMRIVKRGAVLHADVAIFLATEAIESHPTRAQDQSSGGSVLMVQDGRRVGTQQSDRHWAFGRALLDGVRPDPAQDEMVRLWYHAALAFMSSRGDLAALERHVERARTLLPTDATVQYFSGVLHETFASPRIQSAILGITTEIGSVAAEAKHAEAFFRRAIMLDSEHLDARLRLGRTLGALGRHAEAAAELQRVIAATDDRLVQYYGNLFLGREAQALGNREGARAAFERAAARYPRAQSPYLALSQLARRYGDRAVAQRAVQPLLNLQASESDREDPWWDYYISAGRYADVLLAELRQPFLVGVKR